MSASSTMNYIKWEKKVRESIAEDWLELICNSPLLSQDLTRILQTLHDKYQPQIDGSWSASPRWQDMFNWTSCPLDNVHAIILLKGPKTASGRWTDFLSTGYAAGVKRKDDGIMGQGISDISTVQSMLEVAHECLQYPDADLKALVETKYQNGFNPEYLSQRGILFLNLSLTSGHSDQRDTENSDVALWQEFTLGLLDVMPGKAIPMFQWYITYDIMVKISDWEHEGKFVASKPIDLDLGPIEAGLHKHICYLKPHQLSRYAMELTSKKYSKHRAILAAIYQSMVCESKVQTYPAPN